MANTTAPASRFSGFTSPNYTQVPDELFDALMVELSGAELKVLLYIIRRTFGFKRDSDTISLSQMLGGLKSRDGQQLDRGVGISKRSLLTVLRSLQKRGVILTKRRTSAEHGNEPTSYRLNIRTVTHEKEREEPLPPLVQKLLQGEGVKTAPSPRGKNYPTQETGQRETDFSNFRKAAPTVQNVVTTGRATPHRRSNYRHSTATVSWWPTRGNQDDPGPAPQSPPASRVGGAGGRSRLCHRVRRRAG